MRQAIFAAAFVMLAHRLRRVLLALFLRFLAFRKVGSSFSTVFQGATFLSFAARLDDAFPVALVSPAAVSAVAPLAVWARTGAIAMVEAPTATNSAVK